MHLSLPTTALAALLLSGGACSSTPSETDTPTTAPARSTNDADSPQGLEKVGELAGVPESSGLALTGQPGTFYTFGDDGNPPIIFQVDDTGKLLQTIRLPSAVNHDWESLSRDNRGHYFIADAGNNNSDRRNLTLYRFRPDAPDQVSSINFSYPDQKDFPPHKKARNFDCEASVWYDGQIYLFTKDRGQHETSKVYTVPDRPGTYVADLVAKLAISGQVTDASLSPNGRRLLLMGKEEMFLLEGANLPAILKNGNQAKRISLQDAGQTEGVVFTNDNTLYISTEQGSLYRYKL